ncbi:MAG: hypothetical protein Q7J07_06695 [Pelolinea sp.]|nr:hypothetical protein [Pelolinea sp.]
MARGMLVGDTDYSHQSFEDMEADLKNWVMNLIDVVKTLENDENQLKEINYWKRIAYNVQGFFGYSFQFFKTSIKEIESILSDFQNEVQPHHVKRIQSLAKTAREVYVRLGKYWHEDPWDLNKDYGNPDFQIVERYYREARGMAADMIDLGNLASRLEDFIGVKGKANKETKENQNAVTTPDIFIDKKRLQELKAIKSPRFDLAKLIHLCEELNTCYTENCFMASTMLVRAILDHVPPIFKANSFKELCNNYNGGKSFKETMEHLDKSLRKIADQHLHTHIRNKESLPSKTQVSHSAASLDVLLSEIVRIL